MQTFKVGDKVRIVKVENSGAWPNGHIGTITQVSGGIYEVDGDKTSAGCWCSKQELELVEPVYKTWEEMTPEEKGALLLAHHEGKVIESLNPKNPEDFWYSDFIQLWLPKVAYRIKPEEPKVETVVKYGYLEGNGWVFGSGPRVGYDTHKITFKIIDGEPDCNSIKMEKL